VGVAEGGVGDGDLVLRAQPTSRSSWRVPSGTGWLRSSGGSLLAGVTVTGAAPWGWLTVTSAR
jgi:hypothetical protein